MNAKITITINDIKRYENVDEQYNLKMIRLLYAYTTEKQEFLNNSSNSIFDDSGKNYSYPLKIKENAYDGYCAYEVLAEDVANFSTCAVKK